MKNRDSNVYLLNYIQNTSWDNLPEPIKRQSIKCFLDLSGVIASGTKNNSSVIAAKYVSKNFPTGNCTILSTGQKTNLIGAALANGMAANALDLDDGYSLLRGHPGSGVFGAVISAAEQTHCSYGDFLAALVIAYEVSIRTGYAIRDYYNWDHSTGCYSAVGVAAAVGKLLSLDSHQLEMALGIAEFMAPLTPAKRSCFYPSMNKDGVYFGQHVGTQAVMMALEGITGRNPVVLDEKYCDYIYSLGEKYYILDLYIKFNSCCRWVHSPIKAISELMKEHLFSFDSISSIDVYSFGNANTLYKQAPTCEDEAQYNIKYPIAAQLLFGKCGPLESSTTKMLDNRVESVIQKIHVHNDNEYDVLFPQKRLSRVEITLVDGEKIVSPTTSPDGEVNSLVSIDDIIMKIYCINEIYQDKKVIEKMINAIINTKKDEPFDLVLATITDLALNKQSDYSFI